MSWALWLLVAVQLGEGLWLVWQEFRLRRAEGLIRRAESLLTVAFSMVKSRKIGSSKGRSS
jgi:hypothetical protein